MTASKFRTDVESKRGSWEYEALDVGVVHFRKTLTQSHGLDILEAYGPTWLLGFLSVSSGSALFQHNGEKVSIPVGKWGVFYPSNSIAYCKLQKIEMKGEGLWSCRALSGFTPKETVIFPLPPNTAFPTTHSAVENLLKETQLTHRSIEFCSNPSRISSLTKKMIEKFFSQSDHTLGKISRDLKTSSTQLSRSFKKDFGISPVVYRNHLRVTLAKLKLLSETSSIIDVGGDVGFKDHGRFYKAMKKTTAETPGAFSKRKRR